MVVLYITRVIQQKLKFCLQGIVHMNFLKTSVQAEIEIRMINTTYIALIGKKRKKHVIIFASRSPQASNMVKQRLKNLINLDSFSNYKKLPTYKKSKQENKENVSNNDHGGVQADSTYRKLLTWILSPHL